MLLVLFFFVCAALLFLLVVVGLVDVFFVGLEQLIMPWSTPFGVLVSKIDKIHILTAVPDAVMKVIRELHPDSAVLIERMKAESL